MGNHDLIVHEGNLSFEEFKEKLAGLYQVKGEISQAADLYDNVPAFLKILTNFDPTGISGSIDQALSENKAKREQENINLALYNLYQAIIEISKRQISIQDSIKKQLPDLTRLYLENSKNTYDSNKIEYFKNIWLNGIISDEETLEEKAYVFEMVAALLSIEIKILSIFQKKQGSDSFNERKPISTEKLAEEINLDYDRTQQICISLSGKGFLHDYGLGRFDYDGPVNFIITDYVNLIKKYLSI